MKKLSAHTIGVILVVIASSLWALDSLLRAKLTNTIPSATIVLIEHALGLLIMFPFVYKSIPKFFHLNSRLWQRIFVLSLVSSVLGTILFTQAMNLARASFDFTTPLLLQKLQPIFVVILSALFLKEKFNKQFFIWAVVALIGSYLVSFGFAKIDTNILGKALVSILSIGAAFSWGLGTFMSKKVLLELKNNEATFLRFLIAVPIAYAFVLILGERYQFTSITLSQIMSFIFIGLSTGAVSIMIYYKGLSKISPSVSTFAELAYPIIGLLVAITPLNPYGSPQVLTLGNILGIILLFVSIVQIAKLRTN